MARNTHLEVKDLSLDLKNFRTVPQPDEESAIKAMILIKEDKFVAIMESIIEDGYLETENIIVLEAGDDYIVKEGNRRIAALKLIHGIYDIADFGLPSTTIEKVSSLDAQWKTTNEKVPCSIFASKEADKVDRIVALAHGKGEKASRDDWNSVARARHNRDVNSASEPALDILESYLNKGRNITEEQKEKWAGDYPLSVLDAALGKIFPRLQYQNTTQLSQAYPKIKYQQEFDSILKGIGEGSIKFPIIRGAGDFPTNFGIPTIAPPASSGASGASGGTGSAGSSGGSSGPSVGGVPNTNVGGGANPKASGAPNSQTSGGVKKPKAHAINDPANIKKLLKAFNPRGANRAKVVTLRNEIILLKCIDTPTAFCLLLRSLFELSAKAYCVDHGIAQTKVQTNGTRKDKTLAELLREISKHLISNMTDQGLIKQLHSATTEITKKDGMLSVTSMNQIVHSPSFSVAPSEIPILFSNMYPLLEAMNK